MASAGFVVSQAGAVGRRAECAGHQTGRAAIRSSRIGAIAGFLATLLVAQWGYGLFFNIILGVAGGLLGTWLFPQIGLKISTGLVGAIITGTLGAILILFVGFLIRGVAFRGRRF